MKQFDSQTLVNKSVGERVALLLSNRSSIIILALSCVAFLSAGGLIYSYYDRTTNERFNQLIAAQFANEAAISVEQLKVILRRTEGLVESLPESETRGKLMQSINIANDISLTLYRTSTVCADTFRRRSSSLSFVSQAFAQPTTPGPAPIKLGMDDARIYITFGMFGVLGVTFFGSLFIILKTNNPEVLKFAFDTVKTLLGFFIGVVTTFLGLPH